MADKGEVIGGKTYPLGTYIRKTGGKVEIVPPKPKPTSRGRYSS